MDAIKAITIEWRAPQNKEERECDGMAVTQGDISKVWIRRSLIGTPTEVNTFFHELAHVYFHTHPTKLSALKQEQLCETIGNLVGGLLCPR